MPASAQWHGDHALKQIAKLVADRLEAAAVYLQNAVREEVSLTGVGFAAFGHTRLERQFTTRGGKSVQILKRYKKRQRIYGFVRSRPGEPPRKQTGHLRRSITHETDRANLVARVGTNLSYARALELGTGRMAARPFLRSTMTRVLPQLKQIVNTGQVPAAARPSWE